MLRNRSSRLEMVMHLLSGLLRTVGAGVTVLAVLVVLRPFNDHPSIWLQLVLSCFILDLARNGRKSPLRSIMDCRSGVLYPCWW